MGFPPGTVFKTLAERFDDKVARSDECWIWTGFRDKAGYGRIREGGRSTPVLYAHRVSYERHVGRIPDGLVIDHLCRVRHCVNPAHMEVVSMGENARRGDSPNMILHRNGKCVRGHDQTGENVYISPKGKKYCIPCRRWRRSQET